ncbi:MAG: hypothetical protein QF473_30065 [Planctomycetota bacterium]|nr:hypothetical protein [Planctomycetota bacterium]
MNRIHPTGHRPVALCPLLTLVFLTGPLKAEPRSIRMELKGTIYHYFIHVPESYTGKRPFPLFIGVHGFEGKGTDVAVAFEDAADEYEFILVCPTFEGDYMKIERREDLLLMKILKEVTSKYKTQKKVFMAGALTGADFILRFTSLHAVLVRGAALHAPVYPPPTLGKMGMAFSITAGMLHEQSYSNSKGIVDALKGAGCPVKPLFFEDSGLDWTQEAQQACIETYCVVDSELSPTMCKKFEQAMESARELMAQERYGKACSALKRTPKAARNSYYSNKQKSMVAGIERDGKARLKSTLEAIKNPAILKMELRKLDAMFAGTKAGYQIRAAMGKIKISTKKKPVEGEALSSTDSRKARSTFNNGKLLAGAGKKEAAAKYLQKVIDQYPNSKYAAEAKQLLEKLGQ